MKAIRNKLLNVVHLFYFWITNFTFSWNKFGLLVKTFREHSFFYWMNKGTRFRFTSDHQKFWFKRFAVLNRTSWCRWKFQILNQRDFGMLTSLEFSEIFVPVFLHFGIRSFFLHFRTDILFQMNLLEVQSLNLTQLKPKKNPLVIEIRTLCYPNKKPKASKFSFDGV